MRWQPLAGPVCKRARSGRQGIEVVRGARDEIRGRVEVLVRELAPPGTLDA